MSAEVECECLGHKADMFGGIVVDADVLPECTAEFEQRLRFSLTAWKQEGKRGIWLKVPKSRASHIPLAVSAGFEFHHAETGYVMMTSWLPEGEQSTLPANASHQVGVGALIVNERMEVLLVQEKLGPSAQRKNFWKIPTGTAEVGEEIHEAAVREVREETGVVAEFQSIIGFRSMHGVGMHSKSDLFFVCALKPLSSTITIQEAEIADAKWMPVEEWLAADYMQGSLYQQLYEWGLQSQRGEYTGFVANEFPIGFRPGTNFVYHVDGAATSALERPPPAKKPKL